jgi:hypothetical protein
VCALYEQKGREAESLSDTEIRKEILMPFSAIPYLSFRLFAVPSDGRDSTPALF